MRFFYLEKGGGLEGYGEEIEREEGVYLHIEERVLKHFKEVWGGGGLYLKNKRLLEVSSTTVNEFSQMIFRIICTKLRVPGY